MMKLALLVKSSSRTSQNVFSEHLFLKIYALRKETIL